MKNNQSNTDIQLTGRRGFLKRAALSAATPYIVPSTVFGANAPSNRINIGCIGTGFQWGIDTSAFMALNDVRVVAVCDVDRSRREEAKKAVEEGYAGYTASGIYRGVDMYNDFRHLLARDDIDAVAIATPDHWHALIAIAASNAGKDIYCQKPLSYSIAEGRALVDTVQKNGTVFQVGSQQRSMNNFRFACELVRNGRIGELHSVEVGLGGPAGENIPFVKMPVPDDFDYDFWLGPAPEAPYTEKRCHYTFRNIKDYAYGLVTDWGAHHCDTAQWGMGTDHTGPVKVESSATFYNDGLYDTPTHFHFTCIYANGVTLNVGDSTHYKLGIKFIGTEGNVFVTRGMGGIGEISAEPVSILGSVIGPNDVRLYRHRSNRHTITWRPGNIHNTLLHYINFIDCIRSREETAVPVATGHRSISICHLAKISIELGRTVHWNPEKERFVNDLEADSMLVRSMRSPWHL